MTSDEARDSGSTLTGRVALVTGAARRVGRAIARRLARCGSHVIVHYHTAEAEAAALVADLRATGARADAVCADLAVADEVVAMVRRAHELGGRLDIVVNNASTYPTTPLATVAAADWDHVLNVNLRAPFLCALEASRLMGVGGVVINVTDAETARAGVDRVPYQVSKDALDAMTLHLARALAPRVRVNAVAPGAILMPVDSAAGELDETLRTVPLGRLGEPDEIAGAVLDLIETPYSTGVVLPIDGGRRLTRS